MSSQLSKKVHRSLREHIRSYMHNGRSAFLRKRGTQLTTNASVLQIATQIKTNNPNLCLTVLIRGQFHPRTFDYLASLIKPPFPVCIVRTLRPEIKKCPLRKL